MMLVKTKTALAGALAALCLLAASSCDFGQPITTTTTPTDVEGLTGTLVSPDGTPASGAWVKIYAIPVLQMPKLAVGSPAARIGDLNGIRASDSIQTASNGSFKMPKPANGFYNLAAVMKRNDTTLGLFLNNLIVSGSKNLGVDTLKVTGQVRLQVTASGSPVPGVECAVPASPYTAVTDSTGSCVLNDMPPGMFYIDVSHPSFESATSKAVQVLSSLLNQAGLIQIRDRILDPIPLGNGHHFSKTTGTVALWTFDTVLSGKFLDVASGLHDLPAPDGATITKSPYGKAVSFNGTRTQRLDTALTLAGNRFLTYEVRFWLDAYPPSSQWNGFAAPLGNYSGLKMLIRYDGRIQVVTEAGSEGNWNWFNAVTQAGVVPVGQWVDVAVAADRQNNKLYAYVNGVQQALYTTPYTLPAGATLRGWTSDAFTVGDDGYDPQPFPGRIDEIRVSKSLVFGVGAEVTIVSDILATDLPALPTVPALLAPGDSAISLVATPTWGFSWSAVAAATAYQIQVSSGATFSTFLLNDSTVAGTSKSASLSLNAGALYYWRVRAKTNGVWRNWSAIRRFGTATATSDSIATDTLYVSRDMSTDAEQWNIGLGSDLRLSYTQGAVLLDFFTLPPAVSGRSLVKAELLVRGWGARADTVKLEVIRHPDPDALRWSEGTGHWYYYGGNKYNNYDKAYSLFPDYVPPEGASAPTVPDNATWSLAQEVWNLTDTTRIAARWQGVVPAALDYYPPLASTKQIAIDITALAKQTGSNRTFSIRQNPNYKSTGTSTINSFWMYSKDHVSPSYGPRVVLTYRKTAVVKELPPPILQ